MITIIIIIIIIIIIHVMMLQETQTRLCSVGPRRATEQTFECRGRALHRTHSMLAYIATGFIVWRQLRSETNCHYSVCVRQEAVKPPFKQWPPVF